MINKRLLFGVSITAIVAILLLWGLLRVSPIGQNHMTAAIISVFLTVLAFG
jgi:hypothetical protein